MNGNSHLYFINISAIYKIKIYNVRIMFFIPDPLFGKVGFLCENLDEGIALWKTKL